MIKRPYDQDLVVNGKYILAPDNDIEIAYEDTEAGDSGMDEAGYYHRIVTRFNRRTWRLMYAVLTQEEYVYLRNVFAGESFSFQFLNEEYLSETVTAYCRPMSVVWQSKRSGLYKNLTVEIVEC